MSFIKHTVRDIEHDEEGKIVVIDGDLVVSPSDDAHITDLVISSKGSWRFKPIIGVDIHQFLNAISPADEITQAAQQQLSADGYKVDGINLTGQGLLNIKAKRIK